MCLRINEYYHLDGEPLKASQDIVVYKVLIKENDVTPYFAPLSITNSHYHPYKKEDRYYTPYRNYQIFFSGGLATLEAKLDPDIEIYGGTVNEGIHAYTTFEKARQEEEGLRATVSLRNKSGMPLIFRAVIPAGTPFYVGTLGDIVSAKLDVYYVVEISEDKEAYTFDNWYAKEHAFIHRPTTELILALEDAVNFGTGTRGETHDKLKELLKHLKE